MMDKDMGVPASPSGHSAEPEPEEVSALRASVPNAVASMNDSIARAGAKAKTLMVSPPAYDELRAHSDPRDWLWYHGQPALYRGAAVNVHDEWSWGWMVRKADGSFVEPASGTLTEGGDAKQAPGESLSGPARSEAQGDAR